MSTPAATGQPVALPYRLDHDGWVAYLRERLVPAEDWRPGEFDQARWLFTGDPDNPATTSTRCLVRACQTMVSSRQLCNQCRRARERSGMQVEEFVATYQPSLTRHRRAELCVVGHAVESVVEGSAAGGGGCQRRRRSNRTGLCHAHTSQWNRCGNRGGLTQARWAAEVARPLPAREPCAVSGCLADSKLDVDLCGEHFRVWRRNQPATSGGEREAVREWAGRQPPQLAVNQFGLSALAPTVRWELLYALQQRDRQGQRLDPGAVRLLAAALRGIEAVATTPYAKLERRLGKTPIAHSYARMLVSVVGLAFEAYGGVRHNDKDVWQGLALDLEAPRPGRRPNRAVIDFTPISQRWLRQAAKDWVATFRPADTGDLQRTVKACAIASRALSLRPGGGHLASELTYADMTAVFEAIRTATGGTGRVYESRYRRGLWARWHAVLELGRRTDALADLPAGFSRHPSQTIGRGEANEEEIGKAIPETVIAQLDAHLHLLGTDRTYGHAWSPAATAALFQTAYQVLRDTGRRPGELVSLAEDCLEAQDGQYALVYDNHKKHRLRRRLPITATTAEVIAGWQRYRAGLDLPASTRPWLFPAWGETSGPGHLTGNRFIRALKGWVALIPVLDSDLPGPDGTPAPFDRSLISPYAFRHSYAQRHADAGVGVEVLRELMDHRTITVTQGYYTVSLKRKREAIAVMSRYVHDRTGAPAPGSASASRYELRSVAVPFGNCIEPSNVRAGGKQCPIRFQCADCGFYRPDPSYLPAMDDHINSLKADRETAQAIDAEEFVIRNLTDQTAAFGQVAEAMRDRLRALPEAERAQVEQAGALLRKARAAHHTTDSADVSGGRPLLPLTVTDQPASRLR